MAGIFFNLIILISLPCTSRTCGRSWQHNTARKPRRPSFKLGIKPLLSTDTKYQHKGLLSELLLAAHSVGVNIISPLHFLAAKSCTSNLFCLYFVFLICETCCLCSLKERHQSACVCLFLFEWLCLWSFCRELKPSGLDASFAYLVLTVINIYDHGLNWYEYSFLPPGRRRVEWLWFQSAEQKWTQPFAWWTRTLDDCRGPLGMLGERHMYSMWFITFAVVIW